MKSTRFICGALLLGGVYIIYIGNDDTHPSVTAEDNYFTCSRRPVSPQELERQANTDPEVKLLSDYLVKDQAEYKAHPSDALQTEIDRDIDSLYTQIHNTLCGPLVHHIDPKQRDETLDTLNLIHKDGPSKWPLN